MRPPPQERPHALATLPQPDHERRHHDPAARAWRLQGARPRGNEGCGRRDRPRLPPHRHRGLLRQRGGCGSWHPRERRSTR
ncbi:hypothetical protein ACFPRL_27960 [Pseudoclavibacter helvolus]